MRWQYRVTFAEGNRGTVISEEQIFDCLYHFRRRFSEDRVANAAEERRGDGVWRPSVLTQGIEVGQ